MTQDPHHPSTRASAGLTARCSSFLPWSVFRFSWLALLFLLFSGVGSAATVRAYIQPEKAQTGQVVTYVIAVQNGTVQSLPQLRLRPSCAHEPNIFHEARGEDAAAL